MSLVLKSNNAAVNFLADKHGVYSKYQWSFMADFGNQEYLTDSSTVSLEDILTTTRSARALTFDDNGNAIAVGAHTPRIGFNPETESKGLIVESRSLRYEFKSPSSGTKTIGKLLSPDLIVVEVQGSGSVDISGDMIVSKTSPAISDKPMYVKTSGEGTFDPYFTVSGQVSNIVVSTQFAYPTQNTSVIYANGGRSTDERITLDASSAVSKTDYTYLVAYYPNRFLSDVAEQLNINYLELPLFSINTASRWSGLNTTASGSKALEFGVRAYKDYHSDELVVNYMSKDSKTRSLTFVDYNKNAPTIIAVSCSTAGYRIAHNGQVSDLIDGIPPMILNEVVFGLTRSFGDQTRPNGTFNKVAVFDKAMAINELEQLTSKSI